MILATPLPITNLTATTDTQIKLTWTAPDNGSGESCGSYLVKYSFSGNITNNTKFNNASTYNQNWIPQSPGLTETQILTGLKPRTTYWFSIKSSSNTLWSVISSTGSNFAVSGSFIDIGAGLIEVYYGSLSWGDYDNDGDLDLALAGYSYSEGYISKIYRNDNGSFIDVGVGLIGVYAGSLSWGDYDNDGDLDLALAGYSYSGSISKIYKSIESEFGNTNTYPNPPVSGFVSAYLSEQIFPLQLRWDYGTDSGSKATPQKGLYYDIRVATKPISDNLDKWIISPSIGFGVGSCSSQNIGNYPHGFCVSSSTQPGVNLKLLVKKTTYYWQVRSIDTGLGKSEWSEVQSIYISGKLPNAPISLLCESQNNPAAVADTTPEFSWIFSDPDSGESQEAYRILVSTSTINLSSDIGEMLDTGRIESSANNVSYNGLKLMANTSYYWKIMTWDNWDYSGPYCSVQSFYFIYDYSLTPLQVNNLAAIPIEGNKVRLTWEKSTSDNLLRYNIYYSSSSDIEYSVPKDSISYTAQTWTSPALLSGVVYYFVIGAENIYHDEEKNTNIVSARTISNLGNSIKAEIVQPNNGAKISGNKLTLIAELFTGNIDNLKEVYFQYKSSDSTTWSNIYAATSEHPNPDNSSPYYIHWDVSGMSEGYYNIRALAIDKNNNTDDSPVYKTVIIDHSSPDIEESIVNNCHQKRVKIDNRRDNEIQVGEEDYNNFTIVIIPKGVLDNDNATVEITVNPTDTPEVQEGITSINEIREIAITDAVLNNGAITVIMPYKDENNDSIIDNTQIAEENLIICYYDLLTLRWKSVSDVSVNKVNNTCVFNPGHLSYFGIFSVQANNLGNVRAYPNPFKPSLGHTEIKFDQLSSNTKINIYNLAGDLVWKEEAINSGYTVWTVKNIAGKPVASGMYICLITNDIGEKQIIKISIIR